MSGTKLLAVAGASGGHIFPAVSFLQALKEKYPDFKTLLVLPKKSAKLPLPSKEIKARYIGLSRPRRVSEFPGALSGWIESLILFVSFKPDIVIGFGAFESIPLLLLAWFFRAKTIIHEQNVYPGRANRLLAKFVDKIAISFPQSSGFFSDVQKIALTGNPVRSELKKVDSRQALDRLGLSIDKFTILIMGGSSGSRNVNECFLRALSGLKNEGLQFIHITGEKDYQLIKSRYNDLGIQGQAKVFAYFEEMQYAYNAADMAVCRGGATTIAELMKFEIPAVIIPYPFALKHQSANAHVLGERGCAKVIEENDSLDRELENALKSLVADRQGLLNMREAYKGFKGLDSSELLIRVAVE